MIVKPTIGRVGDEWIGTFHVVRDRRYAPSYVVTGPTAAVVMAELAKMIAKVEAGEPLTAVRTDLGE